MRLRDPNGREFRARVHGENFHPPLYIRKGLEGETSLPDHKQGVLDGNPKKFFKGYKDTNSRVTFELDGVWYKVDRKKGTNDLYAYLWDEGRPASFRIMW